MSWQQLQTQGKVEPHATTLQELTDLRAVIERDIEDAEIVGLSSDRRFATAYNAVLQISKMVIACSGYRVKGMAHHASTFQAVKLALGAQINAKATYFDSCRRKRNTVDYDMAGVASETEAEQLTKEAESYRVMAEAWISQNHPQFAIPQAPPTTP